MMRTLAALSCAGLWIACAAGGGGEAGLIPKTYDGVLVATPDPVVLEDVRAGCVRSASLDFVNTSPSLPVAIINATVPDPAFRLSESLPIRIPPGDRHRVDLHFMPQAPGSRGGRLTIDTDEGRLRPLEIPVTATAHERAAGSEPVGAAEPLDLVFVLDVSTTMNELARLRAALQEVLPDAEAWGSALRLGLTTFENDVLVHADADFLGREAFFRELDSQLVAGTWIADPQLARQLMNFDYPENVLDALARSASEFDFRDGARRYLLLMTDDSFLVPPETFSDGTPAVHSFEEVSQALREHGVRLFSVHAPLRGRGLSSGFDGAPSLVAQTEGAWFDIAGVDVGEVQLAAVLRDLLAGRTCR